MSVYSTIRQLSTIILITLYSSHSHGQEFAKGKITDTVHCKKLPAQKYTLYLPANYNILSKFPVILIFDPGGRGTVAVKAFRQSAEKYNFILACSYNSKNGPLNDNFAAAGAVLDDLTSRFSVDNKRIYSAGFSGGSRFALALASSTDFISGVIGCGAGLPGDSRLYPSGKSRFSYYGTAGFKDMNYLDMFDLIDYFNSRTQVVSFLRTFEGGHEWPPPEILQDAVEWITLQAMRKNEVHPDTSFIAELYKKSQALINRSLSSGNLTDAERYMHYSVRDFSGLRRIDDIKGSVLKLDQSKEFRDSNKELKDITSIEKQKEDKYISLIGNIANTGTLPDTLINWWRNEVSSLKTMKERSGRASGYMASRLLNFISIFFSEQGTTYYRQNSFELSGFFFEVCTLSDSENMNNYFNFAKSLAGQKRKPEALNELNMAVDHGLSDRKSIENEPAFVNLHGDEKYKTILNRIK
jgi:predicted esterase